MAKKKTGEEGAPDEAPDTPEIAEETPSTGAVSEAPAVVDHPAAVDVVGVAAELKLVKAALRWLVASRSPAEQHEFYQAFPRLKG